MNKSFSTLLQIVLLFVLAFSVVGYAVQPQQNVAAAGVSISGANHNCGVGYVHKNGKCVAIPITDSRAARIARCILLTQRASDTPTQAYAKIKACFAKYTK